MKQTPVPVVWKSYHNSPARGYWDQNLLEWLFNREWWVPHGVTFEHHTSFDDVPVDSGVVLVTPGHGGNDAIRRIADDINYPGGDARPRPWVLLVVTSDEEAVFPWWRIAHDNMVVWRQYVDPGAPHRPDRAIPCGWPQGTREHFGLIEPPDDRPYRWSFAGQVTSNPEHWRRRQLRDVADSVDGGRFVPSPGFAKGMAQSEYRESLLRSRTVACPTGNHSVDTLRMYEALEAGATPIIDNVTSKHATGFWSLVFPHGHPFVAVDDWRELDAAIERSPTPAESTAWWVGWKRDHAYELADTVLSLADTKPSVYDHHPPRDPVADITVIMPTSPIESHPDTSVIDETIASIRRQLPHAEIIVGCDPPRPELTAKYGDTWRRYVNRIVWNANHRWHNVLPIIRPEWGHQANTTRDMLTHVRTPLVLFVEHDTPIVGDIEWHRMAEIVLAAEVDHMRLHYDVSIHPEHRHLMFRDPVTDDDGFTYQRTRQWSQRPHMARTDWYRHVIDTEFPVGSRTMIEDWMHGVCENNTEWDRWRLAIYHPNDDSEWGIKRSAHLDGRNHADPKFEMDFAR